MEKSDRGARVAAGVILAVVAAAVLVPLIVKVGVGMWEWALS